MPKEDGVLITEDFAGKVVEQPTYQCCHCGTNWTERKGSGITRGYCFKCSRRTCGCEACDACVPLEKRLDRAESFWQRVNRA